MTEHSTKERTNGFPVNATHIHCHPKISALVIQQVVKVAISEIHSVFHFFILTTSYNYHVSEGIPNYPCPSHQLFSLNQLPLLINTTGAKKTMQKILEDVGIVREL